MKGVGTLIGIWVFFGSPINVGGEPTILNGL